MTRRRGRRTARPADCGQPAVLAVSGSARRRIRPPSHGRRLCARLAVTAPHLSRVCRQARGRSASALIRDRQMLEARRLLAYTQIRVAEIAYELGYSDPAYFSRVFAAHTGLSPRAFRQGFTDRTAGDT
ncbi:MAG: helix-turn-helix domain-containing protein [Alphaproteobacteria bacterium]|nr:helix-turn-helix domain-containing protein [Alphaproteobacteria bacterium]